MGEMSKTKCNALIGRQKGTEAERDAEELDVQNRNTEVTFETKDFKVTAGCLAASSESSGTSSDGQDEDDQDETCFAVSMSPKGIRTSRKRPKIKSKLSPAQKKMRLVEEEPLLPIEAAEAAAQGKESRAEAAREVMEQCELSDVVVLVIVILVAFMVFMHLSLAVVVTICF
ncbi:uncharacterized protein LOC125684130 isoform X2 [Lagopus muta]|nr:uncharacterized protein LOC125684130 isoform X2 [Lagopus muta]XP_048781942.1 uncharacterized protein LOC125684130 isoform X2 [Lagopus muta]